MRALLGQTQCAPARPYPTKSRSSCKGSDGSIVLCTTLTHADEMLQVGHRRVMSPLLATRERPRGRVRSSSSSLARLAHPARTKRQAAATPIRLSCGPRRSPSRAQPPRGVRHHRSASHPTRSTLRRSRFRNLSTIPQASHRCRGRGRAKTHSRLLPGSRQFPGELDEVRAS